MRALRLPIPAVLALGLSLTTLARPAVAGRARSTPPAKSLLQGLELFQIDSAHSPIEFSIPFMGLSKVRGTFSEYSGAIALDRDDLTRSSMTIVIRTSSLTTFNALRDRDLKGVDWFDVAKYPSAVFTSREIVKQGDGYLLRGTLELHGASREVEFPFTFVGRMENGGSDVVGFEGHAVLNRKNFGIVGPDRYNVLLGLGKAMVGEDVDLPLTVEAFRPATGDSISDRAADSLWRSVVARGATPVVREYRARRATTPDSLMSVREPQLNVVGYQLLGHGRPSDALAIFALESETFPQSASGLSALAYAYASVGDREHASASAHQAVALNAGATRALEILRRVDGAGPETGRP